MLQCTGLPTAKNDQGKLSTVLKLRKTPVEGSFIKLGSYICIIYSFYFPVFSLKAIIHVQDCSVALEPNIYFSDFNKVEKSSH